MSLKELLAKHPDWADLPIVVYRPDGQYDWLDGAASAYTDTTHEDPDNEASPEVKVLVFAHN